MGWGSVWGRFAVVALAVSGVDASAKDASEVPESVQKVLDSIQTLSSPAANPEDFGFSVALSDRYAAIGAPDETIAGVKSGAVYIFARFPSADGSRYLLIQRLQSPPQPPPPPPAPQTPIQTIDRFGQSVAVFGEAIAIGAPGTPGSIGRVRFFVRDPRATAPPFFNEVAMIQPGAATPEILNPTGAGFGHVVAVQGPQVFIGAPSAIVPIGPTGSVQTGVVLVYGCPFVPTADGLRVVCAKQRVIVPPDPINGAGFGFSLAVQQPPRVPVISLVVGAPGASNCPLPPPTGGCTSPMQTGAMYTFTADSTTANFRRKYTAAGGAANDRYGRSVAHVGPAFAVGAPNDNGGVGSVRILEGPSLDALSENATLRPTGTEPMQFGERIALFNGRIAIAAPDRMVATNPRQGSTFLFERIAAGAWVQRDEVTRPFSAAGANFGVGLAVSGDTLIVGEPDGPGGSATAPGRAYVYFLGRPVSRVENPNGVDSPQDRFGSAVARDGDVMVIGLPGKESGPTLGAGVVQVFLRAANGEFPVVPNQTIIPPAGEVVPGLGFGAAVSVSTNGAFLVVGAPGATVSGAADAGAVFVYPRTATTYSTAFPPALKLVRPGVPTANELFGSAVDIGPDGMLVVAGAPGPGANNGAGGVYVFTDTAGRGVAKGVRAKSFTGASVTPSGGATLGDKWGSSVATDGTTVVAGATEADDVAADEDGYVTVISADGGGYATSDTIDAPADDASSASDEQGFGAAVDIDGGTLVVGAPQTDSANDNTGTANTDEGTAYTFVVASGTASEATAIAAPSGALGDKWGTSVAVSAGTVASGGPGTDVTTADGTSSADQGAVITFECAVDEVGASDCDYDQTMFGKDAEDGEGIGSAIAFDGEEFVVGAPDADATVADDDAGAIYTGADLFSSAAVAVNDTTFVVAEDSSANTLPVLANDTGDLESGAKTVIGVGIATNGTALVAPLGAAVRYTPNLNYCGTDSFTYSLDGGSVATVTLTVTCVDDAGVAIDDAPAAIGEDSGTATFAVLGNDTDVDGGSSVTAVTTATGGTTAVGANGANVTFTPSLNFCGATSFGYTITGNDTATVSFTVTCVNDAPAAVGTLAGRSAAEDESVSFATATGFTDVDNASLAYSATGLPAGLSISPTTGVVSGTIAAGASSQSPYSVTITARDAANAEATQAFQYTVAAPAPGGDLIFGSGFEG